MKRQHSITLAAVVTLVAVSVHLIASQGCISLHSTRTMHARVIDWNTGEPMKFTTIEVNYTKYLGGPLNLPDGVKVQTDDHGEAEIKISGPIRLTQISSDNGLYAQWVTIDRDILTSGGLIYLYKGDDRPQGKTQTPSAVIELTIIKKR